MLVHKVVQYMLSECPDCHSPLEFEPWETSTVCSCGAYFLLRPETDDSSAPLIVNANAAHRTADRQH